PTDPNPSALSHKAIKRIIFKASRLTSCKKPAYRATLTSVASQSWRYKPKSANSTNRLDQSKQQRPPDQLWASVYRKGTFFRHVAFTPPIRERRKIGRLAKK